MKTASEQLLETYLTDNGIKHFEHEPDIAGTTRRPDYRVRLGEAEVFLEVKEFEPEGQVIRNRAGCFDPYPRIRSKINEAQKQLRDLKGQMCAIVLANPHRAFVFLEPLFIYGAMLGDTGVTVPIDPETGSLHAQQASRTFLSGGKMIRHKDGHAIEPQNTAISAICVLGAVAEGSRRLGLRIANRERETGQPRTLESVFDMVVDAHGTEADASLYRRRIQVYENPYAVAPLTEAFGTGSWDERYGAPDGRPDRVFVGSRLAALEAQELAAGVKGLDPLGVRRASWKRPV